MGFGAIITMGDGFEMMKPELYGSLVEVRVEMDLSKPTKFALRFEDDICGGQSKVGDAAEITGGTPVAVFVKHEGDHVCLVNGLITEVKSSSTLGGSGSWVEVHGLDRRVVMDRVEIQDVWSGKAKDAAETIIDAYEMTPVVQDTLITYDTKKNTLNQQGTDLAFLEEIARRNNMELWFEYLVKTTMSLTGGLTIDDVEEKLHLETSPKRDQQSNPSVAPSFPALVPEPKKVLSVNPPVGQCPTVNRFKADIDFEKPTAARGFDITRAASQQLVQEIAVPRDPLGERKAPEVEGRTKREIVNPPAPDPERGQLLRDALVYEESWFVKAEGSTTIRQAGFVPFPHQVVDVTNNGEGLSGAYQIMTVTHVITADEHYADFTARANGLVAS